MGMPHDPPYEQIMGCHPDARRHLHMGQFLLFAFANSTQQATTRPLTMKATTSLTCRYSGARYVPVSATFRCVVAEAISHPFEEASGV